MPQVIALKPCFIGVYRKLGDIFDVSDALVKKHDERLAGRKLKAPTFKVVTDARAAKAEAASLVRAAEEKQKAGALAASGGAAAKAKVERDRDLAG